MSHALIGESVRERVELECSVCMRVYLTTVVVTVMSVVWWGTSDDMPLSLKGQLAGLEQPSLYSVSRAEL